MKKISFMLMFLCSFDPIKTSSLEIDLDGLHRPGIQRLRVKRKRKKLRDKKRKNKLRADRAKKRELEKQRIAQEKKAARIKTILDESNHRQQIILDQLAEKQREIRAKRICLEVESEKVRIKEGRRRNLDIMQKHLLVAQIQDEEHRNKNKKPRSYEEVFDEVFY